MLTGIGEGSYASSRVTSEREFNKSSMRYDNTREIPAPATAAATVASPKFTVTHDQLLKAIWTGNQRDNIQYLRILVRTLRQKIEADPNRPRLVMNVSGVGYRLENRMETSFAD